MFESFVLFHSDEALQMLFSHLNLNWSHFDIFLVETKSLQSSGRNVRFKIRRNWFIFNGKNFNYLLFKYENTMRFCFWVLFSHCSCDSEIFLNHPKSQTPHAISNLFAEPTTEKKITDVIIIIHWLFNSHNFSFHLNIFFINILITL